MEDEQNKKSIEERRERETSQKNLTIMALNFSQYQRIIGRVVLMSEAEIKKKVMDSAILYHSHFSASLSRIVLKKVKNSYLFKVNWGHFSFQVSLLKLNFDSYLFERKSHFQGTYANIYLCQREGRAFAIKSQKIQKNDATALNKYIDVVVQELVSLKIAQMFQFGPKLANYYGYDIVCFDDCIEFSMQVCELPHRTSSNNIKNLAKDLRQNLKVMHSLQIVHCDIKTFNVAWSSYFKKWIYLDFGFAKFLRQKPGFKTSTGFIGTYNYASKQMQSLFHLKEIGFIDLYSNDLNGLQIVVDYLKNESSFKNYFIDQDIDQSEALFIKLIVFRKQLFANNYQMIQELILKQIFLRKQFLFLLIDELQNQSILKSSYLKSQLYDMSKKYSQILIEERKNIENFEQNTQNKKCLFILNKIIKNEQSYEQMSFFEKSKNQLEKYVEENWGKVQFIKELFLYIDFAIFEKGQVFERFKEVITIISDQIKITKGKNWFLSLRNIMIQIQKIFFAHSLFFFSLPLRLLYQLFNDAQSLGRIDENQKIEKMVSFMEKKLEIFFQFMNFATNKPSLNELNHLYLRFFEIQQEDELKNKVFEDLLGKIMTLILKVISQNQMSADYRKQMQGMINELLSKTIYKSSDPIYCYLDRIKIWEKKFCISHLQQNTKFGHIKIDMTEPHFKYIKLWRIIENLQSQSVGWENLLLVEKVYTEFPILREIPQFFNFQCQIRKKNYDKANEIAENVIQIRCQSLQLIADKILYLSKKQITMQKKNDFITFILQKFLLSYSQRIQKRGLREYWLFYFNCISFLCDKGNRLEKNLEKKVLQSINFLIRYFNSSQMNSKHYTLLLQSFLKFIEGKLHEAIIFLNETYQNLDFKHESSTEQQYILCLSFYFRQNTDGKINQIRQRFFSNLEKRKNAYWIFIYLPEVFREYISRKQSQEEVYAAFKILSQHLYHFSFPGFLINVVFKEHIQKSSYSQLEKLGLKISKFEKLKSIRENNHMSAFIGCLFLKLNESISPNFSKSNLQRLLILSLVSINKFMNEDRIQIRNKLATEVLLLKHKKTLRKKLIVKRAISYVSQQLERFEQKVLVNLRRIERVRVFKKMNKKIQCLAKNIKAFK